MSFKVTVQPAGLSFDVARDEAILPAAMRANVGLPYGCRDGACGSCKSRLVEGRVIHGAHQLRTLTPAELRGKPWVLNVWASWCVACRAEHPLLVAFSKRGLAPVYGLDYKDARADATAWLARFGDPYEASLSDADGRVGIDYGVYGVPETFVIDKQGWIRHKVIGPLTAEILRDTVLPLVRKLDG